MTRVGFSIVAEIAGAYVIRQEMHIFHQEEELGNGIRLVRQELWKACQVCLDSNLNIGYTPRYSMNQITEHKQIPQEVQDKIMGDMVFFKDGIKMIALGSYALDFKQSYAFLGFTKNKTQVILGDIHTYGALEQDGTRVIKYKKRFGRVEYEVRSKPKYEKLPDGKFKYIGNDHYGEWRIVTDGYRYSEVIMEVSI
ncbi:hypothetical protein LCGC14_1860500 [marine sediment metagenome]|uniref:Uncharacterized protein n=1 Tax=marine sediment metagenome TaxID=412755 RepID=A0A0F9IM63_9ZZZZ